VRCWSGRFEVNTSRRCETLDITAEVARLIAASGIRDGIVHIASLHTTAAITVNEHEPRLMQDLHAWLAQIAPAGHGWKHDALARSIPSEPENTDAHLKTMLLGGAQTLALEGGSLLLGTWQRVILVECDGPRRRKVGVTVLGA